MRTSWTVMISLLCLVSFATSAAAECAWVLWEDFMFSATETGTHHDWSITLAVPDLDRCLKALIASRDERVAALSKQNADLEIGGI